MNWFRLYLAVLPIAVIVLSTHDYMVGEIDAHQLAGILDGPCYLVIHPAGASVLRWVVMADGQDGGVVEYCILHDQANVHQGLCNAALRQFDMLYQSVVLVHLL